MSGRSLRTGRLTAGAGQSSRRCPAVVGLAVLAFTVVLGGPAGAKGDPSDTGGSLAVVNAGGGTFRAVGDGFRLVLTGVVPRAVWFNDRPARKVGSFALDEFADSFFRGDDDPNAALEVFDGPAAGSIIVIELSNPRVRSGSSRLVFVARILSEADVGSTVLSDQAARAVSRVPARFGPAALYVDDAGCLGGNGGTGGTESTSTTSGDGGSGAGGAGGSGSGC